MSDKPSGLRRGWAWIALVPGLAGLLAVLLYQVQGGLGGGHARFDRAIPLLELPSSLVLLFVEPPELLERYPLTIYLLLPTAINVLIWLLTARAITARKGATVA